MDPMLKSLAAQLLQVGVASQQRIDPFIVTRIVAVIGARFEDRIEVQDRDTQLLQTTRVSP